MHHPRAYFPALDRIEGALEAACGALVALQSINGAADGLGEVDGMQTHVGLAVESLREAIEELRMAQSDGASALAIGFVLKGNGRARRDVETERAQSKPRRTA